MEDSFEKPIFKITKKEISDLFESYNDRRLCEDIDKVKLLGGVEGLSAKIKTHQERGLDDTDLSDLEDRKVIFDDNQRNIEKMPGFFHYVLECLDDTVLRILIVSSIFQIVVGSSPFSENPRKDWIDGFAIVFALIVIVATTSVTNYSKEKKFKQMSEANYQLEKIIVKRNNKEIKMNEDLILVGDLVKLNYGMIIPADGIVVESQELLIDEACITGESDLVCKNKNQDCYNVRERVLKNAPYTNGSKANKIQIPSSLLFSGTTVSSGSGWFLVLAVGKNSTSGRISESIRQVHNEEQTKTPLEIKLNEIAEDIGKIGLIAAILTLVALTLKLTLTRYEEAEFQRKFGEHNLTHYNNTNSNSTGLEKEHSTFSGMTKEIISILILCITIIVVAIPEGLPLAVTLSLSFSVRKMMNDNNLVRRMNACETMGGANYICTDKTGTLTKNDMSIFYFFDGLNRIDVSNLKKENKIYYENIENPNNPCKEFQMDIHFKELLVEHICSNIDISLNSNKKIQGGSKTDIAFYRLLNELGYDYLELKSTYQEVLRIPFSSERRRISTIISGEKFPTGNRIHMKGAAEIILESCSHYIDSNFKKVKLNENSLQMITDLITNYDKNALRTIALCYKEVTPLEIEDSQEKKGLYLTEIERKNFTLIGIAAIKDGIKDGVAQAVTKCQSAGIKVIMVTGDNIDTAKAIARESNIVQDDNYLALEGSQFFSKIQGIYCETCDNESKICDCPKTLKEAKQRGLTKLKREKIRNIEKFKDILKDLKVIARARPLDKYALILGLREIDEVVAVTGDGTNDAPALSRADVGFAMGIEGTDAARNAADIIILDDNFSSIVNAVIWGRNIYDNIRKFIQFQLSVNVSSVALVFICSWIGSETPISSIQMLWINLIMDSLGSLALATQNPTLEVLNRKPYKKREYIISSLMWKHIIFQALVQFLISMVVYLYGHSFIPENNVKVLKIIESLDNCFDVFPGIKIPKPGNITAYYVLDGKKSTWSPLVQLNRNVSPLLCQFNDRTVFDDIVNRKVLNLYAAFRWYNVEFGNTVHMTIVFNIFVFYSLFNQINSRIIDDSFNILHNIKDNTLFIVILICEIICQILIIEYGGLIFKCSVFGLTFFQWMVVIAFSSSTFFVSFLLKLINFEVLLMDFKYNFIRRYLCCCFIKNKDNFEKFIDDEDKFNKVSVENN